MTHKKKINKFLKDFERKFPDYIIIEFKNIGSSIIVKDTYGTLYKKHAARDCFRSNFGTASVIDKHKFISQKIEKLFPNLKLISYNGMKEKLTVIDENQFTFSPQCYDLLQGHPVSIQTCNEKEEFFKFKANEKHNNFYTYLPFKYKNGKQKIDILCSIHGIFNQSIEGHLHGNACKKCSSVGFSKKNWLNKTRGCICILYILKIYNEKESFIKIGITSKSVEIRYKYLKNYKYEKLLEIKKEASEIYDLEKSLLNKYLNFKYYPKEKFEGKTECFTLNILNKLYEQFKNK